MLQRRLARQRGRPAGAFGRFLARGLNKGNRATNERAVALLGIGERDRALDAGFGGGVGLDLLLAAGAALVSGAEHSPDMVAAARKRFADEPRVTVVEADLAALPFPDDAFDAIVSVHTVYFWRDPPAVAAELARVLAPGGRIVLAAGRKEWMEQRRVHRTGFTLYDDDELADLLSGAGLRDARIECDGPIFALATGS